MVRFDKINNEWFNYSSNAAPDFVAIYRQPYYLFTYNDTQLAQLASWFFVKKNIKQPTIYSHWVYSANLFLPFRRLLFMVFRPDLVDILLKKP